MLVPMFYQMKHDHYFVCFDTTRWNGGTFKRLSFNLTLHGGNCSISNSTLARVFFVLIIFGFHVVFLDLFIVRHIDAMVIYHMSVTEKFCYVSRVSHTWAN